MNMWTGLLLTVLAGSVCFTSADTYGASLVNRAILDTGKNWVLILGDPNGISMRGVVSSWNYYASRTGVFTHMVWRPSSSDSTQFTLIGSHQIKVLTAGAGSIQPASTVEVEVGDLIGIYWTNSNPIPFDYDDNCNGNNPTYAVNNPPEMTVGGSINAPILTSAPCRTYSLEVDIAPHTFGASLVNRAVLDTGKNWVLILGDPNGAGVTGVLNRWNYYAGRTGVFTHMLWRRVYSSSTEFTLVASQQIKVLTAGVGSMQPSSTVEVHPGDLIGIYWANSNPIPFDYDDNCAGNNPTYAVNNPPELTVGGNLNAPILTSAPCRTYSLEIEII